MQYMLQNAEKEATKSIKSICVLLQEIPCDGGQYWGNDWLPEDTVLIPTPDWRGYSGTQDISASF